LDDLEYKHNSGTVYMEDIENSEMAIEDTSMNIFSDVNGENTEGIEIDNNPSFGTEGQKCTLRLQA